MSNWADNFTPSQIEKRRERARQWRRENPKRAAVSGRAYSKRHPEVRAARNAVYYALKRGKLTKLPCEICGDEDSQAHHEDYSQKLDVRWLCRHHHAEADVARRKRSM